jgi:cytochrome c
MNRYALAIFSLASIFSSAAHADANLAKAKNCVACHAADKRVIGPAFKEIASRYGSQKGAEDQLAQKVLKGSSGVWGGMSMPPNTTVNQKEAQTLVKWILSHK